ncbi:MAG: glutathione S-transferase N-terminal domain-containing protein [Proteobacteria bacterium]|nr:glutathione S-transferase N-terminal domain-containing protein [Pseudomonadota bacterium]
MKPLLYTFRRCPFAIRARLAIKVSGVEVDQQEVSFCAKPKEMLECSPKSTLPVLKFADGSVLEQSLDIMYGRFRSMIPTLERLLYIGRYFNVNPDWFYASRYHHLIAWLDRLTGSTLFQHVMQKEAE